MGKANGAYLCGYQRLASSLDSTDRNFQQAAQFLRGLPRGSQLVITNYIQDKLYTLLLNRTGYTHCVNSQRTL